jgi:protein TonB
VNARSPYFLSAAGHMTALLVLWILSTLSPHYDFDVIEGIELIIPQGGGAETAADEPMAPSPEPAPETAPEVPPAVPPQEEPPPEPRAVVPPEEERKRPVPEEVSDEEPQPDGLRPPSKDAIVPSKRGEEQQQQPSPQPAPQQSDAPDVAAPQTAEFRRGIGEGRVDGNALGKHADWYLMQLHHKLTTTWAPPAQGSSVGVQMATVHFVILRDGRIRDVQIVDGNANTRFQRSVQRCILNASPLPPLPEDLAASSIGVTVPFRKQY